MGFYIRKSFRAGPLRLNLSKRGLGLSVGVTGARVGIAANGRAYVHAGRGGLYVREYLSSGSQVSSGGSAGLSTSGDPLTVEEDTGVTFHGEGIPSSSAEPLEASLIRKKRNVVAYLLIPVGAVILGAILENEQTISQAMRTTGYALAITLLVVWPIPMIRAALRNRRGSKLGLALVARFSKRTPLTPPESVELQHDIDDPRISDADRAYQCRLAYLHLLEAVVADGTVSADETRLITQVEELCHLDPEFHKQARIDVFRRAYLALVADRDLTEEEDSILNHIRTSLAVGEDDVSSELQFVERLREIRAIRGGVLPTVTSSTPLPEDEICHDESPVRLLKARVLRSYQSGGQKYKVRGLVVDKEGTLVITSKRLLIVHDGATSVPFKKVLAIHVDTDRNLLAITKDGSTAPVYLTTPDALRAGALMARLAGL